MVMLQSSESYSKLEMEQGDVKGRALCYSYLFPEESKVFRSFLYFTDSQCKHYKSW